GSDSVRRSERTHRAQTHLCVNVEAEEHSLGDLNETTSYKAAMLDPESKKWIDAMKFGNEIHDRQYGMGLGRSSS
ncbi:hypothetical protein Tco_0582134, partial [Tanacetum coccineum]